MGNEGEKGERTRHPTYLQKEPDTQLICEACGDGEKSVLWREQQRNLACGTSHKERDSSDSKTGNYAAGTSVWETEAVAGSRVMRNT